MPFGAQAGAMAVDGNRAVDSLNFFNFLSVHGIQLFIVLNWYYTTYWIIGEILSEFIGYDQQFLV